LKIDNYEEIILNEFHSEKKVEEICNQTGVSPKTVSNIWKTQFSKEEITNRNRRMKSKRIFTNSEIQQILDFYKTDQPTQILATKLKTSKSKISRIWTEQFGKDANRTRRNINVSSKLSGALNPMAQEYKQFERENKILISVVGGHANESLNDILKRKLQDIHYCNKTYWLLRSHQATRQKIQEFANNKTHLYCVFISSTSPSNSNTKTDDIVSKISSDGNLWENVEHNLSKITGKIDKMSVALVIQSIIKPYDYLIDLNKYNNFFKQETVKMYIGGSTICSIKNDSNNQTSKPRKIIAIAKLIPPFAVSLKKWLKNNSLFFEWEKRLSQNR